MRIILIRHSILIQIQFRPAPRLVAYATVRPRASGPGQLASPFGPPRAGGTTLPYGQNELAQLYDDNAKGLFRIVKNALRLVL